MIEARLGRGEHSKTHRVSRFMATLMAAGSGAACVGLGIGIEDAIGTAPQYSVAIGYVKCAANKPVEGVWVSAGPQPSSGWATKGFLSSDLVSFNRIIEQQNYTVHVGCGGTTEVWATANYGNSEAAAGQIAGFLCELPRQSTSDNNGVCNQVGIAALNGTTSARG